MSRRQRDDRARSLVDQILQRPPVTEASLVASLSEADGATLRRVLVERLRHGDFPEDRGWVLAAALLELRTAEARPELCALITDRTVAPRLRALALTVAFDEEQRFEVAPRIGGRIAALSREDPEPAEIWLGELLAAIQADAERAETLTRALEATATPERDGLLQRIEACRQRVGTPAVACYAHALQQATLVVLREPMLAALVCEPSAEAVMLLESLRRATSDGAERRRLQRAVMQARTRRIDAHRHGVAGCAHVSSCDSRGGYILVGCFENPDGTLSAAQLCVHVTGQLRDAAVLPRRSSAEIEELLRDMERETGLLFVHPTLAEAATLVAEAAAGTAEVSPEVTAALALFDRVTPQAAPSPEAVLPSPEELLQLALRHPYAGWRFERADLTGAGNRASAVEEPQRAAAGGRGADESALQRRVAAMARHMSRWHAWRGEAREAALCVAMVRATTASFADSPLVQLMLQRSVHGDPVAASGGRRQLRDRFFPGLETPKGRDLARLDFAEVALAELEEAVQLLPELRRPGSDERTSLAFALGKAFADYVLGGGRSSLDRVVGRMQRTVGACCRLSHEESEQVLEAILPALGRFLDERCAICDVGCIGRPRADVSEAFFAPRELEER
jgi:hypothetical protein